jgi:hypothetical protein
MHASERAGGRAIIYTIISSFFGVLLVLCLCRMVFIKFGLRGMEGWMMGVVWCGIDGIEGWMVELYVLVLSGWGGKILHYIWDGCLTI